MARACVLSGPPFRRAAG